MPTDIIILTIRSFSAVNYGFLNENESVTQLSYLLYFENKKSPI